MVPKMVHRKEYIHQKESEILERISDAFYALDTKWRFTYVNKRAAQLWEKKANTLIGKIIWEVFPKADNGKMYKQHVKAFKEKKPLSYETTFPTADKRIQVTLYPHNNGLYVYFQDNTARKKTYEKQLQSEEKFKKLFEKSSDVIAIVDEKGNRLFSTPSVKTILGYEPEEFMGSKGLTRIHPDDLPNSIQKLSELKKTPGKSIPYIQRIQHKNGSWIWVEGIATNLLQEPAIHGIVLNYRDVTARIENEQRKDNFIAMASHELKTPLTSVKVFTQVLQKRFEKLHDKESLQIVTKMEKNLEKLNILIKDMLDVAKLQQGKIKVTYEKFLVKKLVEDIVEDMQPITRHKLILDWHTKLYVYADKERIRQVLVNLIMNAVKYSPREDKIIIKSNKIGNFLEIGIQDFGIGIPKTEQGKVFERYYQANSGQTFPGLGLGLYISNEIIKANGGEMRVESEEGKGSTVYFTLPIYKEK